MKALHEFATLADAQAHEEITETHQVGSGQARGYFAFTGIWTKLRQIQQDLNNPVYPLADAIIATATDASSYFGMNPTTADGIANRAGLDTLVQANIMTLAQKDEFLSKTKSISKPYENTTQDQFDAAKAKFAASGETLATSIYLQGNLQTADTSMFGAGRHRRLRIVPIFDSLPTHDCTVTIQMESETLTEGLFATETKVISILVKAGQEPTIESYPNTYRATKLRVKKAKVDLANAPFRLEIEGTGV